jgi:acyl-CoA thioester hydrolase
MTERAKADRPEPHRRADYLYFAAIPTRWMDNDVYGHVNNVQYYSFFDTVVNGYLIDKGVLFDSLSFPQTVEAGLRVARLGQSSVRYEIGLFASGADVAAAQGHFVHVYVDRATRRPVLLPNALHDVLSGLMRAPAGKR